MTETFAPPFSRRRLAPAPVRERSHFGPQTDLEGVDSTRIDPTRVDLTRASGYLAVDARGRLVGRVEGPTFAGPGGAPAALTLSWGFLWLRRCLVAAESIEQIDDSTRVIGLRIDRRALRAGRA